MKNKELIAFFVLLIATTSLSYINVIKTHSMGSGVFNLMWSPGIAALVTCLIFRRSLRGFGWLPGNPKWLLLGYLLPIAYALVAYGIVWSTGLGGVPNHTFLQDLQKRYTGTSEFMAMVRHLTDLMVIRFIPDLLWPLGEEIGWRGFLIPDLVKRMSYAKASLMVGIIWAVWHYPAILFTGYNNGTPWWFAIPCFTAMVISCSFITAWLRLQSKSIWPCVIWHGSHNSIVQAFFTPITVNHPYTKFFIDEFGIFFVIAISIAAYLCWRFKVPEVQPASNGT